MELGGEQRNLSAAYLREAGITSLQGVECVELMGEVDVYVARALPGALFQTLWIEPTVKGPIRTSERRGHGAWNFHCVPLIDGLVHDAWHPDLLLPPEQYAMSAFPGQSVSLEILQSRGELQ